jgi:iron complex outermembrane receptor protein
MIPMAALDRIEVLRDGASSLYGSDAVGGVINFITKSSFTGGVFTAGGAKGSEPGGVTNNLNLGFGKGDLQEDKFNFFGFIDHQHQNQIKATDRNFTTPKYSANSSNYSSNVTNGLYSPNAPSCSAPNNSYVNDAGAGQYCQINVENYFDLAPESERTSAMLNGTFLLPENHKLTTEYFITRNVVTSNISPSPISGYAMNPNTPYYPGYTGPGSAGIPLFAHPTIVSPGSTSCPNSNIGAGDCWDPTAQAQVYWRDTFNGNRADQATNTQQRFVTSLSGMVDNWDYQSAFTWNQNKISDFYYNYPNTNIIAQGILNGVINPFGAQSAAGTALINSANVSGAPINAIGTVVGIDGHASRELSDWFDAGRPAAIAIGAEYRHEKLSDVANSAIATELGPASTGIDPNLNNQGARSVYSLYSELNIPLTKNLDVTGAARFDKYSDFGSTTNPKVSFRYQPNADWLFRGSLSTGYRAPSLYDLNAAQTFTNTAGDWTDPLYCPNGVAAANAPHGSCVNTQRVLLTGGNTNLKPETSKNATFGFVYQPIKNFDAGLDFWWIELNHQIGTLSENTVFDPNNYSTFGNLFHRMPDGSLSISQLNCPSCGYANLQTMNLGSIVTDGVDFTTSYRLLTEDSGNLLFKLVGTFVDRYEYSNYAGGPMNQNVGVFSGSGPIFRMQDTASVTWSKDDLSLGLAMHYKSGYLDQDQVSRVAAYDTFDLYGSYKAYAGLTFTYGIRNLRNTPPPASVQNLTFQTGYDPRFYDVYMRTFYLNGTYRF